MNNITIHPNPCGRELHDSTSGRFMYCGYQRPSGYVIRCNKCTDLGTKLMLGMYTAFNGYFEHERWPAMLAVNICLAALLYTAKEATIPRFCKKCGESIKINWHYGNDIKHTCA